MGGFSLPLKYGGHSREGTLELLHPTLGVLHKPLLEIADAFPFRAKQDDVRPVASDKPSDLLQRRAQLSVQIILADGKKRL